MSASAPRINAVTPAPRACEECGYAPINPDASLCVFCALSGRGPSWPCAYGHTSKTAGCTDCVGISGRTTGRSPAWVCPDCGFIAVSESGGWHDCPPPDRSRCPLGHVRLLRTRITSLVIAAALVGVLLWWPW